MAGSFKKKEVKLELLTDTDSLLMVEKGTRGTINTSTVMVRASFLSICDGLQIYQNDRTAGFLLN